MADSLLSLDQSVNDADREAIITKWKDKPQDELLNAKAESDLYIKTLTSRLDDLKADYLKLREEHQTSAQLKDLVDRLEKERSGIQTTQTIHEKPTDTTVPSIKPEDISKLISEEINRNRTIEKQTENFATVQRKLREQFGDNYHSAYKQRLDTLGLTQEFADDLARNHPAVFFKTFELDSSRSDTFHTPPKTQQRPSTFAPKAQRRDWNYYQELKKNDPRLYLDPKIAVQMHNDMMELGSDFGLPED